MIKPLSDEDIEKLIKRTGWGLKRAESLNLVSNYNSVAQKAQRDTLRQVVAWLEKRAISGGPGMDGEPMWVSILLNKEDLQEIKKLAELKNER